MAIGSVDVMVLGGGPAGATAALLLQQSGAQVVLVDDGRLHPSGPHESLLPASAPLLARAWPRPWPAAAIEPDPLRHGAIWNRAEIVFQPSAPGGLLLRRGSFDQALRAAAAAAGVRVLTAAAAEAGAGVWRLVATDGIALLAPRCVVFATGRRRPRSDLAPMLTQGPGTAALTWVGRGDPGDAGTAVVEAVADGWLWSQVLPDGSASVAALVDAERLGEQGGEALLASLRAGCCGPFARCRDGGLRYANDATARTFGPSALGLVLGDAAATIDPLASQGVAKALAAADHAAAAVRTALQQPGLWPRLCALHARWEAGLATAHARAAAGFYRAEERFPDAPFWRRRRLADDAPATPVLELPLQAAAGLRSGGVLERRGDRFVEVDGIVDGDAEQGGEGLSHIGFVPVAPILAAFAAPRTLAAGVAAAGADPSLFVLPPAAVRSAAVVLWQRGWLRAAARHS